MRIVVASDSYKESLSANEVAQAIEKGFWKIFPDTQYVSVPAADGGEGMVEAMIAATQRAERHVWVTESLGEEMNVGWGISGDDKTTFIEMAAASGLELVSAEKRNPLMVTSHGTGELILQALESGVTNIIIGIGGSATNDGGTGMIQTLGTKLCGASGNGIGLGDGSLNALNDIDVSGSDLRLEDCVIHVACDATNSLVGDNGASRIFGPQEGASETMIVELDNNFSRYAEVTKRALHVDVRDILGTGAAGGIGAVLVASPGAELRSGVEIVTTVLNLKEHIHDYTLVTTDEGRIDSQSIHGKVSIGVTNVAERYHKPVVGTAGNLTDDVGVVHRHGIDAVFSVLTSIGTLDGAFHGAYDNIYRVSRNITMILTIGMRNAG